MKKIYYLTAFLILISLFVFLSSKAYSDDELRAMVIKVEGSKVKVNLGKDKGALPGKELYVCRMGKPVGKVKIIQVDDYYSWCEVVSLESGSTVKIGDVLRSSKPESEYAQEQVKDAPASTQAVPEKSYQKGKTPDFEKALSRYTKIHIFKVPAVTEKNLSPYPTNYPTIGSNPAHPGFGSSTDPAVSTVFDLLNLAGYYSLYSNPVSKPFFDNNWFAYSSLGGSLYAKYEMVRRSQKIKGAEKKASLEITYWCDDLVNEYADYYAYKEALDDETLKEKIRKAMKNEKGMKDNIVFEVRINNDTNGIVHLAPFDWHIYLVSPDGTRYKAERCDKSLDNSLGTNQSTSGFVYFKKISSGGPIKIILEDIHGGNKTFTW